MGVIKGLFDGMIKQVASLFAMIVGIYLCSGIASWVLTFLTQIAWFPPKAVIPVSYFLGFILIVAVVLLTGNIIHRLISATPLSILNHLTGGFVGLIFMLLLISVILNLIELLDHNTVLISHEIKIESKFYFLIKNIISTIFPGNLFQLKDELFA